MTKEEAIGNLKYAISGSCTDNVTDFIEEIEMAIEALQDKIDEEESPCYNCYDKHCDNCLYSGRIPE